MDNQINELLFLQLFVAERKLKISIRELFVYYACLLLD